MKRCPQCNRLYSDFVQSCPQCNLGLNSDGSLGNSQLRNEIHSANRESVSSSKTSDNRTSIVYDKNQKMGWHKFMIYFSLFAGALVNISSGVQYLTGMVYELSGVNKSIVYMTWSNLQPLDIFYGFALISIAAYAIYVRFQLAGFKIGAPKKLMVFYSLNIGILLLYIGFVQAITGLSPVKDNEQLIGNIIGSLCVAVISITYYKKRKSFFVN